jgi:hypothetical protein
MIIVQVTKENENTNFQAATVSFHHQPQYIYKPSRQAQEDKQNCINLPALRLHPLDLLYSPLERELEKLLPARHLLLLAHHTLPDMEALRSSLLPNLILRNSTLKLAQRRSKVRTALRLDVSLSTERRSKLHLDLADWRGRARPVAKRALGSLTDGPGEGVREDSAGAWVFPWPLVEVKLVEDVVEVGHRLGVGGAFGCLLGW